MCFSNKQSPTAVFLLDSKNSTGDIFPGIKRAGIDAHVYVSNKSGKFELDPSFKDSDYSNKFRSKELRLIADYHKVIGVKAIVIPITMYLDLNSAKKIIEEIKVTPMLNSIPIIQLGGKEKLLGVSHHIEDDDTSKLAFVVNNLITEKGGRQ